MYREGVYVKLSGLNHFHYQLLVIVPLTWRVLRGRQRVVLTLCGIQLGAIVYFSCFGEHCLHFSVPFFFNVILQSLGLSIYFPYPLSEF